MQTKIEILSPPAPVNMADEWFRYASADHFWIEWRFQSLLRLLHGIKLGRSSVEIGCGNGVVRKQIECHFDCAVDGWDLNQLALESAPAGRGRLCVYNIHDRRPEFKSKYDSAFMLDVLEHIEVTKLFLDSTAYHLSDGGYLVINVPALPILFSRYDKVVGHQKRYTKKILNAELTAAGFEMVVSNYWGFSMLPVAAARKVALSWMAEDKVVSTGFVPPANWIESILRAFGRVERAVLSHPPLGTSLLAVARKRS